MSMTFTLLSSGLFMASMAILFFENEIKDYYSENSPLFNDYLYLLFPFFIFSALTGYFDNVNVSRHRTAQSAFFKEIIIRVLNLLMVCGFYFELLSVPQFLLLYTFNQGAYLLYLVLLTFKHGDLEFQLNPGKVDWGKLPEQIKFGLITMLAGATTIANQIDIVMIGAMIGLKETAIYGVAAAIGKVIMVPARSINRIGQAVIADTWKANDLEKMSKIYRKSATINIVLGCWIVMGIWINEASLFRILPEGYEVGRNALLILCLSRLIGIGHGFNATIIRNSRHYAVNSVINILGLLLVVGTNLVLIPIYGITGAALATLIATALPNLTRYLFLKIKYGLEPFGWKQFVILLLAATTYALFSLAPNVDNLLVDIVWRSIVASTLFLGSVYVLKLSPDFSELADMTWRKFRKLF